MSVVMIDVTTGSVIDVTTGIVAMTVTAVIAATVAIGVEARNATEKKAVAAIVVEARSVTVIGTVIEIATATGIAIERRKRTATAKIETVPGRRKAVPGTTA